jgi:ssDNA-binding Zn-finger/Zn-ribbon topoisomerase 1
MYMMQESRVTEKTLKLRVKCPSCDSLLLDENNRLDNAPSIKALIEYHGRRGWVRLSSVYGSYEVQSELPIPPFAQVDFMCPECFALLKSDRICVQCRAPLVDFQLEEGGIISICSRRGCRQHFLEFCDDDQALAKLYEENSIGSGQPLAIPVHEETQAARDERKNKEIIASGTYLAFSCPHCGHNLNESNTTVLTVVTREGQVGKLMLSPYLNVFTHQSTEEIPLGEEVQDLQCPHCRKSFMESGKVCEECGARIAKLAVIAINHAITFYICMKKGCTWHGISDEDTMLIALEDSMEW